MHRSLKDKGFTHGIYGDIFLEDLKQYRDQFLERDELSSLYPLWKQDSRALLKEFFELGFRAIIVCVNSTYLDESFCERSLDEDLIKDLPANVDPCGENGEFHSFVFDGPIFSKPMSFTKGDIIFKEYRAPKNDESECFTDPPQERTGFYFCDLEPNS